ncbi:bacteriohemerythrin [Pseudoduganella sp. GCM10020061]|uniref:bacteriohemerythrin n=1 Tax=Pseudoduganella sp. GCM10020061 TaxID=3317345 RepID=UPI0036438240
MSYFSWTSDMSVGNTLLDHDHRVLVALVNDLHTATSRGEGREVVGAILDRLFAYTQQHFQREEHHMQRVQYSKAAEHTRLHQDLLRQVLELKARFDAGHVTVAAQVSALLRDWLSLHILRDDRQFAAELAAATGSGVT